MASTSDGTTVPVKTLRITNNTGQTVYPIMRDPNSNTIKGSETIGLYDPYDPRPTRSIVGISVTSRVDNTISA